MCYIKTAIASEVGCLVVCAATVCDKVLLALNAELDSTIVYNEILVNNTILGV